MEKKLTICNRLGLHARAATKFANVAKRYSCKIEVELGDQRIDGKSVMALMLLAAAKGSEIVVRANGEEAGQSLDALESLINNRFDEED